ncbi:MAG TPA: (d)CMP kinase [Candidatus Acidoferrales bacterium]|nr:(d)CMP kinase [Candidatus Acidoferrales bacterium]
MKKGFIIAIDGPLASGKGTIAKKLARVLLGVDLYTGAMYRCVALYCINSGINLEDGAAVTSQLGKIVVGYIDDRIVLNDTDVTDAIQDGAIAEGASIVGVIPEVRAELVRRQQEIGQEKAQQGNIVIVEGRDIGTVVFPDAALKIFLTATETIRANRRMEQYHRRGDIRTFVEVFEQIRTRDKRDTKREMNPLTSDPEKQGYFVLDNSDMNEEQTINEILAELRKRKLYD